MEANELRIGNLVIGDGLHDGEIRTVKAITDKGTLTNEHRVILFENYLAGEFMKDVKGIELTPEWLGRLGFEDRDESHYWKDPIHLLVHEGGCLYLANQRHVDIFYVHQLQNLFFALTGRELELKEVI